MTELLQLTTNTLRERLKQLQSPLIIGVAGDSGSGKTTFSNGVRRLIGDGLVSTICTDGYHKEDREQRKMSGRLPLDPEVNFLDVLEQDLQALKQGKTIQVPIYNHATGKIDPPEPLAPTPIIIVEGLHVLYPQFLPYLDFSLYVDPERDVKWKWKWERDIKKRGHKAEALEQEMLQREAAFVRWIDFQKIHASIVIQVGFSEVNKLVPQRFIEPAPEKSYKVNLILEPAKSPLPSLHLPFDLATMLEENQPPFLLAAVPFRYWGRTAIAIHIDGIVSQQTIVDLEKYIVNFTGIPLSNAIALESHEQVSAIHFAQLIIAWRFLEQVNQILQITP